MIRSSTRGTASSEHLPAAPSPLVSRVGRVRNGRIRSIGAFGDERAGVPLSDADRAFQAVFIDESGGSRSRVWVELPRPAPGKRDTAPGLVSIDIGEKAVHTKPVVLASKGEESRAEVVQAVVDPGLGVDDAPPASVLPRDIRHRVYSSLRPEHQTPRGLFAQQHGPRRPGSSRKVPLPAHPAPDPASSGAIEAALAPIRSRGCSAAHVGAPPSLTFILAQLNLEVVLAGVEGQLDPSRTNALHSEFQFIRSGEDLVAEASPFSVQDDVD